MSQKTTINIIFISQTILLQFLPFLCLPAPIISININCFYCYHMYSVKLITHSYWQKSLDRLHCTATKIVSLVHSKELITTTFSTSGSPSPELGTQEATEWLIFYLPLLFPVVGHPRDFQNDKAISAVLGYLSEALALETCQLPRASRSWILREPSATTLLSQYNY